MNKTLAHSSYMNKRALTSIKVTWRRITRHPITKRTLRSSILIKKHVVRGAALGLVPNTLNDVIVHHAPLNLGEIIHVAQDTVTVSGISAVITVATFITKF